MVGLTYYDPWYNQSLALHKAIGIVVLALALAKFGWTLADRKTGFGPEVKPYERAGATAMHWVLNALMVMVPVTGYLISTSEGAAVDMFGLFEVPALFDATASTRDLAIDLHYSWPTAALPWSPFTPARRSSTISSTRDRPSPVC